MKGIVTNIQRYSLNDGDGIRTIVFLKGCPLHCLWCSNPETQNPAPEYMFHLGKCIGCSTCRQVCPMHLGLPQEAGELRCTFCGQCEEACPTGALTLVGKEMDVKEVLQVIERDRQFYGENGGLTISGGEALWQWEFSKALAKSAREDLQLSVALETTGFAPFAHLLQVCQYCDQILFDVKHPRESAHIKGTGVSNRGILENLQKLAAVLSDRIVIRVPLIEGYNAEEADIEAVCTIALENQVPEVHLLPYHEFGAPKYNKLGKMYDFWGRTPSDEKIEHFRQLLMKRQLKVVVGG